MSLERQSREDCKRPHLMHQRAWLYLEGDNSKDTCPDFSQQHFLQLSVLNVQ